ncbi:MAG: 4-(cytidine 5'-diphospho)-2-C-methyl-D-erythritol kinase [bacterium]
MNSINIKTPAKINLGLYITGKRPNGYHELASIFLPVGLFDNLDLNINSSSNTLKINVSGPFSDSCPSDEKNIVFKIYNLMKDLFMERKKNNDHNLGIDLTLTKNIPSEAGLGGGSSDAAGFLKALNQIWDLNLSIEELKTIGSKVGADVPFFIQESPAMVTGIGDIIRPFKLERDYWVIVIKPKAGLSTAQVYKAFTLDLTLKNSNVKHSELLESLSFHGLKKAEELSNLSNNLERVSSAILPDIIAIRSYLDSLSPNVCMMSGSGSAVFALFDKEPKQVLESLNPSWFLCSTKVLRGQYANYRDQSLSGK